MTAMNYRSVFHFISDITEKEGVACILIGGFAVNYYRVSRQTADVDFLITKDDFERIIGPLEKAGYKRDLRQENFIQLKSTQISLMDVDFMFVDKNTLSKILKESQEIEIAKQKFRVPSLEHLIALKLHSMKYNPKLRLTVDLPDIIHLIRINEVKFKEKKFAELCRKFGNEEIYKKILEALE